MASLTRSPSPPAELLVVTMICFGWAIYTSTRAMLGVMSDSPLNDAALMRIVITELTMGSLALLLLQRRGYNLMALVPAPAWPTAVMGLALYGLIVLAHQWLVAPWHASFAEQPIDTMVAQASVSMPMLMMMALVNGTYEEVFLLGFLCRALHGRGLSIAIGVSLLVRLSYHLYQGPLGALSILILGIVVTLYYVRTGDLFAPVVAHVAADIVPFL